MLDICCKVTVRLVSQLQEICLKMEVLFHAGNPMQNQMAEQMAQQMQQNPDLLRQTLDNPYVRVRLCSILL